MNSIEQIARAALSGDAITTRALVQDWLRTQPIIADVPPPSTPVGSTIASVAAGLAELFAERLAQPAPSWTALFGAVTPPIYLVKAAERMPHLREACRTEAPLPLRRRQVYAPANYLEAV